MTAKQSGEEQVLAAIAAMPEDDRKIGERLHQLVRENAPDLEPRTWYGMPAYSNGSKILMNFMSRAKFGQRYMSLQFQDAAHLDEGTFWPVSWALTELTPEVEEEIAALIRRAVS